MYTKISLLFLLPFIVSSQCDEQNLYFSSDSEIESFIEINSDCKTIFSVTLTGPDITNLALMSFFDTIHNLIIYNIPAVKDLEFLEKTEVLSSISLLSLDNIESLSKFYDSQPYNFHIISCPKIKSVNLSNDYYNNVTFHSPNLDVLVFDQIDIASFDISNNVIIHTLEKININQMWLQNATSYTSFASLATVFNLDTLVNLQIVAYDQFSSEGFPDSMVCRGFSMSGIKNLNCDGFENKTAFFNTVSLTTLDNVKDLSSFDDMIAKKSIIIAGLDSLTSLDGIPISENIEGIFISDNPMLTDIQGIMKVNDTYRLSLIDNPQLATCNNRLVCDLIEAPNSATRVKKILNFDYPTASGWSIRQNFSNLKVGNQIFFVIRHFYAKTSFYDSDASIGEFKY
ncbi:MAG: hypothetical protein ACJATI_003956 [Halioglobus sp.]|jgi:hypothetical protein